MQESFEGKTCPKCGGPMAAGYSIDYTYGGMLTPKWVAVQNLRKSSLSGSFFKKGDSFEIISLACSKCGYIESYLEDKLRLGKVTEFLEQRNKNA